MAERQRAHIALCREHNTIRAHKDQTKNSRGCVHQYKSPHENVLENVIPQGKSLTDIILQMRYGWGGKKNILLYTPPLLSLMLEGLWRRDATVTIFTSAFWYICDAFWGNTLPFCTRFHPFCRKYCKSPKWKPLNSSSLRLTRIDVIASLGLPWKHGAPKNSNTLIQPALGLAWRGWLFVSIHNPSSDS